MKSTTSHPERSLLFALSAKNNKSKDPRSLSEPACLDYLKRASAPKHATTQRRSGRTCRMAGQPQPLSGWKEGARKPEVRCQKPGAKSQQLLPQPRIKAKGQRFSKTYPGEILVPRIEQEIAFARNQNAWDP